MKRQDQGPNVLSLQRQLNTKGYKVAEDAQYGLETEAAIRDIQHTMNLNPTGIVDLPTERALLLPPQGTSQVLKWYHKCPYLSQRDNINKPSSTCGVTSIAMVLNYWGISVTEDQLYDALNTDKALSYFKTNYPNLQNYPIYTVHGMLGYLCTNYGLKWKYQGGDLENLLLESKTLGPVVTSGAFTKSGHIVVIVGETSKGDIIVNDPWGDYESSYQDHYGFSRIYNRNKISKILSGYYHKIYR